jgi:hypothetical protein
MIPRSPDIPKAQLDCCTSFREQADEDLLETYCTLGNIRFNQYAVLLMALASTALEAEERASRRTSCQSRISWILRPMRALLTSLADANEEAVLTSVISPLRAVICGSMSSRPVRVRVVTEFESFPNVRDCERSRCVWIIENFRRFWDVSVNCGVWRNFHSGD